MKITKIGHCCLLVEKDGTRLLTDPGVFSEGQDTLSDIDAVLITHEHADHLHLESLKRVVANNPDAQVITNAAVAKILKSAGVAYTEIGDNQTIEVNGVTIRGTNGDHAEIHPSVAPVLNTAFMIGGLLFYPGDAFVKPGGDVPVLALPVAGPWLKISEALDYALTIKPKQAFPVHDGILLNPAMMHPLVQKILASQHIQFTPLVNGESLTI